MKCAPLEMYEENDIEEEKKILLKAWHLFLVSTLLVCKQIISKPDQPSFLESQSC